jgi:membrane protease YdiL (CAAX protease family)
VSGPASRGAEVLLASPLLAGARQARISRNRLLAALFLLAGMGVALAGGVVTAILSSPALLLPLSVGVQTALVTSLTFAGVWLGLWLWVRRVERRPFQTVGFEASRPLRRYLAGFALGVAMFGAVVALMALVGAAQFDGVRGDGATLAALGIAALAFSVQGSGEEVLIRGWLLPVAAVRFGLPVAMVVQSGVFTLLHGVNPGITPVAVLNLVLVSLLLGVWALREGALWTVMGWHAAWNWTQGNVFGIAVSGIPPTDALLPLKVAGPDWLAGGGFGAEASVLTSFVLAAALLVAVALPGKAAPFDGRTPTGRGGSA